MDPHPVLGRAETLPTGSCYGNWDKFWLFAFFWAFTKLAISPVLISPKEALFLFHRKKKLISNLKPFNTLMLSKRGKALTPSSSNCSAYKPSTSL